MDCNTSGKDQMWRFRAYKSEKDYTLGDHYFEKYFTDYNELKEFSAKHSMEERQLNPNYISMYWNYEILAKRDNEIRKKIEQIMNKIEGGELAYHDAVEELFFLYNAITSFSYSMINRVEVIDEKGRCYVNWKPTNKVELQVQDNGRTLKIFVSQVN